ncbi:MAG: site-2 protease family protein [Candidatus Omnitrophota bacterium]
MNSIARYITTLPAFLTAVVIHEYAHGWIAYKLGDNTAKDSGRLTLNPLSHIDPIGTVVLPLFLILTRSPIVFGWAKPVPVNIYNLRNPKRDMIWVGLAGPLANFLGVFIFYNFFRLQIFPEFSAAAYFLETAVVINLILGIFNLIPMPPLDGSKIVIGLLPRRLAYNYSRIEPYGVVILILLLLLLQSIF